MIDLGTEGKHLMEIVAFDVDDKADGSGKAKITWISKDLLNTNSRTSGNAWSESTLRSYLKNTIKPLVPATVRNSIVEVTKYTGTMVSGSVVKNQTSTEDLWIPSTHEFDNTWAAFESEGATYPNKFTDSNSRIKKQNGVPSEWWLRSSRGNSVFLYATEAGGSAYDTGSRSKGVALGFCTD